jgi:hypothetical protein
LIVFQAVSGNPCYLKKEVDEMKNELWGVILVVAIFMGFMMGYSLPPMLEVGMIGAGQEQETGLKSGVDEEMDQYYRDLLKAAE